MKLKGLVTELSERNCVLIFKFFFRFGLRFEENAQQKFIEGVSGFCENRSNGINTLLRGVN